MGNVTSKWVAEKSICKQYNLEIPQDNIQLNFGFGLHSRNTTIDKSLVAVASYNAGLAYLQMRGSGY